MHKIISAKLGNAVRSHLCSPNNKRGRILTSARRSSIDAAEKVGTISEPLTTEVMKGLPDSASSHVMHAAGPQISENKSFH